MKVITKLFQERKTKLEEHYNAFTRRPNVRIEDDYNGIFYRFRNPVLTDKHIPLEWRYDFDEASNPF